MGHRHGRTIDGIRSPGHESRVAGVNHLAAVADLAQRGLRLISGMGASCDVDVFLLGAADVSGLCGVLLSGFGNELRAWIGGRAA